MEPGVGFNNPSESLPTEGILLFCDSKQGGHPSATCPSALMAAEC